MNVATRPIRQPSVKVRFTLVVVIAVVVLHCAVTLALLVRASRFALAAASLGATPAAHNQTADLIRTGLLWVALTLLSIAGAALALRHMRVAKHASDGTTTHPDQGLPEIVPDSFL